MSREILAYEILLLRPRQAFCRGFFPQDFDHVSQLCRRYRLARRAQRGLVLLPRKTARYVSFVLMAFLCALRVEAEARYSGAGDGGGDLGAPLGLGQNEGALQNGLGVRPSSGRSEATRGRDKRERFGLTPRHSANEAPRRDSC